MEGFDVYDPLEIIQIAYVVAVEVTHNHPIDGSDSNGGEMLRRAEAAFVVGTAVEQRVGAIWTNGIGTESVTYIEKRKCEHALFVRGDSLFYIRSLFPVRQEEHDQQQHHQNRLVPLLEERKTRFEKYVQFEQKQKSEQRSQCPVHIIDFRKHFQLGVLL